MMLGNLKWIIQKTQFTRLLNLRLTIYHKNKGREIPPFINNKETNKHHRKMKELKLNQIGIVLFVALTTYVTINLLTYGWVISSASFTF